MTREEAIEILRHYDDLVWQDKNKVTMGMVADAIRMGEEALQSPWKSVKEELPEEDMLLVDYHGIPMVAQHYKNGYGIESWWDINGESCRKDEIRYRFTHFMPIPDLPKEKEDAE